MVTLDGNVRQRDPAERKALAELRAGSVPKAVAWYARNDRVQVHSIRVDTLVAMADAWSTDLTGGHDTALLAWRRQDVADLNRLAREHWDKLGRLPGDEVKVNGGPFYAPGDRLVALAPHPQAGIVTSEPLTAVWGVARYQRWNTDTPARPGRAPIPVRFSRAQPPVPTQPTPPRSAPPPTPNTSNAFEPAAPSAPPGSTEVSASSPTSLRTLGPRSMRGITVLFTVR